MSKSEVICTCDAYPFPHRYRSGKCDTYSPVAKVWREHVKCMECPWRNVTKERADEPPSSCCRVLDELLYVQDCPGFFDVVRRKG